MQIVGHHVVLGDLFTVEQGENFGGLLHHFLAGYGRITVKNAQGEMQRDEICWPLHLSVAFHVNVRLRWQPAVGESVQRQTSQQDEDEVFHHKNAGWLPAWVFHH